MSVPVPQASLERAVPRVGRAAAPRATLVGFLRLALPAFAGLTTLSVVAALVANALGGGEGEPARNKPPVELAGLRLFGEDEKGRAFVITALSAARDPAAAHLVKLDRPVVVMDQGGPEEMRVTAGSGVYDESGGRLQLGGGVKLEGARGVFSSPSTVLDTKTGDVVGTGAIQGSGSFGSTEAGSFAVKEKGGQIIYKGGVHSRLNMK